MSDLHQLLHPGTTAVVTMEMQRGVVGDLSTIADLAEAARTANLIEEIGRLLDGARDAGATVCHATVSWRADRRGTSMNTPMGRALSKNPAQILDGSDAAHLLPAFAGHGSDLRSHRHHGFTPFTGTDLDALLRNCGIRTIIATGVSVNVGILGLVLTAVDLGYSVVVPTDAVVGMPSHYAAEVIHHSIAPLAALTTIDDILATWSD
jgi:nicotinamidase-related amidase